MEFQIIRRNVIIVIIVVRYLEFQMARDLRIFDKHFAHEARDLDTRNYLATHIALSYIDISAMKFDHPRFIFILKSPFFENK